MGKPTGFIEFKRISDAYEKVDSRVKHYREFVPRLSDAEAKIQGAHCMDCGIPHCNKGCAFNNTIYDCMDIM